MAATTSSSWTSPEAAKKAHLERLQANAGHIHVMESPFFPHNLSQYLEHERKWIEQNAEDMVSRLEKRQGDKRDVAINLQHSNDPAVLFNKGEVKAGGAGKAARTIRTLAEDMEIWTLEYLDKEQRRDTGTIGGFGIRACWPEQNELKAEGEHRQIVFGERRLPLPRKDEYSSESLKIQFQGNKNVSDIVRASGDDIAWYERAPIQLHGLDRLESTTKEFRSEEKTWTVKGSITPPRPNSFKASSTMHQGSPSRRGGRRSSFAVNMLDIRAFSRAIATIEMGRTPPPLNVFASNFTPGADSNTHATTASNTGSNITPPRNKNLAAPQTAQPARTGGIGDGSQNFTPQAEKRGARNNAAGLGTHRSHSPGLATSASRAVSCHRRRGGPFGRLANQGRGGSIGTVEGLDGTASSESTSSAGARKTSGEAREETARQADMFDDFESEEDFLIQKGMGDLLKEL
ncbi:hypothetical protein BJ875DRAFT_441157 [Amylocarpus encephaloides]|uniref:Uncharacterized protein n=1 Tax=Amylocarpus encephaloides TaxID=45428 RepID=A0A9P7YK87_9HELO|nr:hypothetical protein BJ875DRAFT_441157 [Amylocarpus encephaloides]